MSRSKLLYMQNNHADKFNETEKIKEDTNLQYKWTFGINRVYHLYYSTEDDIFIYQNALLIALLRSIIGDRNLT